MVAQLNSFKGVTFRRASKLRSGCPGVSCGLDSKELGLGETFYETLVWSLMDGKMDVVVFGLDFEL